MSENKEEKWEHFDIIVRRPAEGDSWFDRIFDLITEDCEEAPDPTPEGWSCKCGLESMGGTQGTLQQCYDHIENVGHGLKLIDLARAIYLMSEGLEGQNHQRVIEWAKYEISFEESLSESESDED